MLPLYLLVSHYSFLLFLSLWLEAYGLECAIGFVDEVPIRACAFEGFELFVRQFRTLARLFADGVRSFVHCVKDTLFPLSLNGESCFFRCIVTHNSLLLWYTKCTQSFGGLVRLYKSPFYRNPIFSVLCVYVVCLL